VRYRIILLICMCFAVVPCGAWSQEPEHPGNDDPRVTTSLGIPLSGPLSPTAEHVGFAWGVNAGVGYNIDRRNALIGEFMWNSLYPTNGALEPIRIALLTSNVSGHGNLFAFTGNYRLELRGRAFGTYLIGGPGWYYRTAALSRPIPNGTTITCDPIWVWWGYSCAAGFVINNLTEVHHNSGALGFNAGVGFTARVGEAPYRMYVESRYHFAPTGAISTKLVAVTVGIRY
jgi:Outer membrane protein beta-barrel domain